jgi:glycosyltransferase involved in cell wall biosynthesis
MKKLRLAFIYGPYCLGFRKFDFSDIWDDRRGLSGSELSFLRVALGMHAKGHEVHLYTLTEGQKHETWEGLKIHEFSEINNIENPYDAAISWNEAELFRVFDPITLRIVSHQLNSFNHCTPSVHDFVDVWASPSEVHKQMLTSSHVPMGSELGLTDCYYVPNMAKWEVVPHGCDTWRYDRFFKQGIKKVPGRVIWGSSPDRGLHWLLQEWPKIKRAVPEANLRIFYRLKPWLDHIIQSSVPPNEPSRTEIEEQKARANYIVEALRKMKHLDIEVFDSVSRNQIEKEMAEAQVLAYTCDPVRWTEGFSITLMESCAAMACPITTAVDALPDVYGGVIPMIDIPLSKNIGKFSDLVIKCLQDSSYREEVNRKVRSFAEQNSWEMIVDKYEKLIYSRKKTP